MKLARRAATLAVLSTVAITGLTGAMATTATAAAPTQHPAVVAAAAPAVTATVSARTAANGQSLTFSGRASAGATIVVQYAQGRQWATAGRGKATSAGRYSVAVKHARAADLTYRVAGVVGKKTTYSPSLTVKLARPAQWYWLANYKPSATGGYTLDREASANLGDGSQQYALTEVGWGDSSATWRINGACSRMAAFAGSGINGSPGDTQRQVEVVAEGRRLFTRWFAPGEGQNFDVSLAGARAVTVSVRHKGSSNSSQYGLGNAKVLCTAPPGEFAPVD